MPQLILIRHGQSQWNLENRFTECEPFADYKPDPFSRFMTRVL